MFTLDPAPATCLGRIRYAARITRRHPVLAFLWVATFGLLVASTLMQNDHMGRWALWVTIATAVATLYRVGRWMITRLTQIYEALHFDVRLGEHPSGKGPGGGVTALRTGRRQSH